MRGALIVFEGLDRSGKSTQCEKLVEQQRRDGKKVHHMRFPNRSTPTAPVTGMRRPKGGRRATSTVLMEAIPRLGGGGGRSALVFGGDVCDDGLEAGDEVEGGGD